MHIQPITAQKLGLLPGVVLVPERPEMQAPLGLYIEGTVINAKMTEIGKDIVHSVVDLAHAHLHADPVKEAIVIWVPKTASQEGLPENTTCGYTVFQNDEVELVAFQRVLFVTMDEDGRSRIETPSGSFYFIRFDKVTTWSGERRTSSDDRDTVRPPANSIAEAVQHHLS